MITRIFSICIFILKNSIACDVVNYLLAITFSYKVSISKKAVKSSVLAHILVVQEVTTVIVLRLHRWQIQYSRTQNDCEARSEHIFNKYISKRLPSRGKGGNEQDRSQQQRREQTG